MENTKKRALIWVAVIILIAGGIYGVVKLAGNNGQISGNGDLFAAVGAGDWFEGNKQAKTVLVEYSDYQCPACALFYQEVQKIVNQNSDKIQFVYRNFPLSQHQNAATAAYAAESAGKQNKFWEMHDLIFTNQTTWSALSIQDATNIFIGYATTLGLNINQFKNDMSSQEIKTKVENDYQTGIKSGVEATPTFYLNGKKITNINSFDDFRNIIQQAIDSAK